MATIHNPTNFEPSDYEVVDYLDNRPPTFCAEDADYYKEMYDAWRADLERVLGVNYRQKINRCIHCGNGNVRWITAVRHIPTNEVVIFGSDCTQRLGFRDKMAFRLAQLQNRDKAAKVRFAIILKRKAFLAQHPDVVAALDAINRPEHAKNFFAQDVLRKLDHYGSLSDRQIATMLESLKRDRERAAQQAAEAAEGKGPAPSGRQEVTGTILTIRGDDGPFGYVTKMLLKLDNNAKVWVTMPAGSGCERGDRIRVKATWTVSKDDPSFAFGSRPHLVEDRPAAEPKHKGFKKIGE